MDIRPARERRARHGRRRNVGRVAPSRMYIRMYTTAMTARIYSVADARAQLPRLLDEVEAGREIRLTRRGRAVAVVLSTERYEAMTRKRGDFGQVYRSFVARHPLREVGVDSELFESIRGRGSGRRVPL
jgi:prevent-host-death family protein